MKIRLGKENKDHPRFMFTVQDAYHENKKLEDRLPVLEIYANTREEAKYFFVEYAYDNEYMINNYEIQYTVKALFYWKGRTISHFTLSYDQCENDYPFLAEKLKQAEVSGYV